MQICQLKAHTFTSSSAQIYQLHGARNKELSRLPNGGLDRQRDKTAVAGNVPFENVGAGAKHAFKARTV